MKRLSILACGLFLLVIAAPALHAGEEGGPAALPVAGVEAAATLPGTIQLGPYDAPIAVSSHICEGYYYAGRLYLPPSTGQDPVQACTELCAQNGDTYLWAEDIGRYNYLCYCCPS